MVLDTHGVDAVRSSDYIASRNSDQSGSLEAVQAQYLAHSVAHWLENSVSIGVFSTGSSIAEKSQLMFREPTVIEAAMERLIESRTVPLTMLQKTKLFLRNLTRSGRRNGRVELTVQENDRSRN